MRKQNNINNFTRSHNRQMAEAYLWRLSANLMEFFTTRQLLLAGRGDEASGSSMLGSL